MGSRRLPRSGVRAPPKDPALLEVEALAGPRGSGFSRDEITAACQIASRLKPPPPGSALVHQMTTAALITNPPKAGRPMWVYARKTMFCKGAETPGLKKVVEL